MKKKDKQKNRKAYDSKLTSDGIIFHIYIFLLLLS